MLNWKIHYFDWAMFNSYVKLPEGTNYGKSPLNHHFLIGSTISMAMFNSKLLNDQAG
jgi:hypothetical protein